MESSTKKEPKAKATKVTTKATTKVTPKATPKAEAKVEAKVEDKKENLLVFNDVKEYLKFLSTLELLPNGINRPIGDKHVQKLVISVLKLGVKRMINVVRTSAFGKKDGLYILDAQHLTKAILSLNASQLRGQFVITIDDIEDKDEIIDTLALINTTFKPFSLEQHLKSWVAAGKKDYIILEDAFRRNNQKLNGLIEAFSLQKSDGNEDFKRGRFIANTDNYKRVQAIYDKALKSGLTRNKSGYQAIVRLHIDFPHLSADIICDAIKRTPAFGFSSTRDAYLNLFKQTIGLQNN